MTLGKRLQACDHVAYCNGPRMWLAFWEAYNSGVSPEDALVRLGLPVPEECNPMREAAE